MLIGLMLFSSHTTGQMSRFAFLTSDYVTYQELEGCSLLVVTRSLIVKQDYTWVLNVHCHPVDPSKISSLALIPHNLTRDSATLLLSRLAELNTCVGNPEPKIVSLRRRGSCCLWKRKLWPMSTPVLVLP